jgi:hypothetical protein
MPDSLSIGLHILALTDNGVQCSTQQSTAWAFWLGRHKGATWVEPPEVGNFQTVIIPMWAAKFHQQLNGAVDYERRARAEYAKPISGQPCPEKIEPIQKEAKTMPTTKDNSGALFKNSKKDEGSPNQPDYTGDLLYNGERLRLAGWVRESARGKFLSLSVKPDEQPPAGAKPAAKKPAMADTDEIAF